MGLRQRWGQARAPGDRQKATLELGVCEREDVPLEEVSERGRAAPCERVTQSLRIDEVELVRLVDECLELAFGQSRGQVEAACVGGSSRGCHCGS